MHGPGIMLYSDKGYLLDRYHQDSPDYDVYKRGYARGQLIRVYQPTSTTTNFEILDILYNSVTMSIGSESFSRFSVRRNS